MKTCHLVCIFDFRQNENERGANKYYFFLRIYILHTIDDSHRCRQILRRYQRHDGSHAGNLLEVLLEIRRPSVFSRKY